MMSDHCNWLLARSAWHNDSTTNCSNMMSDHCNWLLSMGNRWSAPKAMSFHSCPGSSRMPWKWIVRSSQNELVLVMHTILQNNSHNFPSCPPDIHCCSGVAVYWTVGSTVIVCDIWLNPILRIIIRRKANLILSIWPISLSSYGVVEIINNLSRRSIGMPWGLE